MLGARAMALVRLKRFDDAATWGAKAAARPNAHAHILAIATYCLALAGRQEEAAAHMVRLHTRNPNYNVEDFLMALQFGPADAALWRLAASRVSA